MCIRDRYQRRVHGLTEGVQHSQALREFDPNINKMNRYSNILPYKHTEVKLPRAFVYEDEAQDTYINANFITSCLVEGGTKAFIACQGPLEGTRINMWRMIWTERVAIVFMLCRLKEDQRVQCDQYWPEKLNAPAMYGPIRVTLVENSQTDPALVERTFTLEDTTKPEEPARRLIQFHWIGWPDHGVPKESDFPVVERFVEVIVKEKDLFPTQPIVIHCSAGVGRTGTLMALYNLRVTLKKMMEIYATAPEDKRKQCRLSVFAVVRRLREQRWGMVNTAEQYAFIYELVADMIDKELKKQAGVKLSLQCVTFHLQIHFNFGPLNFLQSSSYHLS
eukprot:TRINITY_DN9068_c0_g1_i4.p1 TRINITY_DN9068_c0_g1~~TRINITY_DN9068_c0_g1_i4.p1  ORF type:complete len:354 (-),score=54.42 TRINITY_DN9068_c0_g1_i4:149-1150(-)